MGLQRFIHSASPGGVQLTIVPHLGATAMSQDVDGPFKVVIGGYIGLHKGFRIVPEPQQYVE